MTLNDLMINQTGFIQELHCNGDMRRRFLDLGMIKNTAITPILKSPFGDTRAYKIRGAIIALRKEDSEIIQII